MKFTREHIRAYMSSLLIALGLFVGFIMGGIAVQSVLAAWVPPTAIPPGDNPEPPLNTSVVDQTKTGGLTLGGLTVNNEIKGVLFRDLGDLNYLVDPSGDSFFKGKVGIGVTTPLFKLVVADNDTGANVALARIDSTLAIGDNLGTILFRGGASGIRTGATVRAEVDGIWGGPLVPNVSPTRLSFFTQSDKVASELSNPRMVINKDGDVSIEKAATVKGLTKTQGGLIIEVRLPGTPGGGCNPTALSDGRMWLRGGTCP